MSYLIIDEDNGKKNINSPAKFDFSKFDWSLDSPT